MRTANYSKFHTVPAANGQRKIGVFTGADFCSEHEWGIKRLRDSLGMRDDVTGVARRRPTNGITNVHLEVYAGTPKNPDWMAYLLIGEDVSYTRSYKDYDHAWSENEAPNDKRWRLEMLEKIRGVIAVC